MIRILIFLLLSNFCFGQIIRVHYLFNFKKDSLQNYFSKSNMVLQIGQSENLFLSEKYLETDSINNENKYKKTYTTPNYSTMVIQKDKGFRFIKKLDLDVYSYDDEVNIKWKILPEQKNISGYTLQKAVCNYGGRNWIAWFSNSIPLNYGPYIFNGLPGLIFEIYDDKENFKYSLTKIEDFKEHFAYFKLNNIFEKPLIHTNKDKWKQVQIDYYNNPLYIYKTVGWKIIKSNGKPYDSEDYRQLEIRIKENIIKNNNPIELNDIITYK